MTSPTLKIIQFNSTAPIASNKSTPYFSFHKQGQTLTAAQIECLKREIANADFPVFNKNFVLKKKHMKKRTVRVSRRNDVVELKV